MHPLICMRLLLAVAYPLLAHWATFEPRGVAAVLALCDLAALVLLGPLARGRAWAWAALGLVAAALWRVRVGALPGVLLLAPPVLFAAFIGLGFARSLGRGRVPLVVRIMALMEGTEPAALAPELARYGRRLTLAWALLLAALALANAVLGLVAVPDGALARLGIEAPFAVSRAHWSWFANLLDYGILGGFFAGEYLVRRWRFPQRADAGFVGFVRRMAALGPGFWRDAR